MTCQYRVEAVAVTVPVPRGGTVPAQVGGDAQLAALLGIVALVLLGSVLTIRNRLERSEDRAVSATSPSQEFVTDRERVCQLVRDNGGRMKQSAIVDSVDWSKAKVSRLLADLEEDGEVTKLRLGRENLVCLPGHEPTASKSTETSGDE